MPQQTPFEFVRLVGDERRTGPSVEAVSKHWQGDRETFLFVSPHDDDVVIGGGLMILSALAQNVDVHVCIVTDGSAGYCELDEKDTIAEIRREETFESFKTLGLDPKNIHWLGFPDCQLTQFIGRRPAAANTPAEMEGFTGLQNAFTHILRKVNPTQVFLPTNTDLHPDHRIVHSELMISLFHAAGGIWPELGQAIPAVPHVHEMAVYCDFPTAPKLRLTVADEIFEKKLQAILDYKSQKQIKALVENIRQSGPMEFFRPVEWQLYNPKTYYAMFDEPKTPQSGGLV